MSGDVTLHKRKEETHGEVSAHERREKRRPRHSSISSSSVCRLCTKDLDDPRRLGCFHTFCLKCIKRHCASKQPGEDAHCPVCREPFRLPIGGADNLPKDVFIDINVDIDKTVIISKDSTASDASVEEGTECQLCSRNRRGSDAVEATMYCVDCQMRLCDSCSAVHQRRTGKKHSHSIIEHRRSTSVIGGGCSVGHGGGLGGGHGGTNNTCLKHIRSQNEFYCYNCKMVITCATCLADQHRDHHWVEMTTVADACIRIIKEDMEAVEEQMKIIKKESKELKRERKSVAREENTLEARIRRCGEERKRLVDADVDALLQQLKAVEMRSSKEIRTHKMAADATMEAMETYIEYSRRVLRHGSPSQIVVVADDLHARANQLLMVDPDHFDYNAPDVTFTELDLDEMMTAAGETNIIGTLNCSEESQLIHTLPEAESVWGVTTLGSELFVLRDRHDKQIEVFDISNYRLQRHLTVPDLHGKADITSCSINSCLYVSDSNSFLIHRVEVSDDETMNWHLSRRPAGLSVTHQANLLVVCRDEELAIEVYATRGELLHVITLDAELVNPWHAILLASGDYVVCHGEVTDSDHRVCVIGDNGHVIRSYGGLKGSMVGQLHGVPHLAVDARGYVYVADCINRRVLLLNPKLVYVRRVVSRGQGLKWFPGRLCLDGQRKKLYVAENESEGHEFKRGRVLVFNV